MTLNNILRSTAIGGVFAALVVPFVVSGSLFFPFISGKGFLFRVVVEIAFAAWLLLVLRDASARPRKSVLLWVFIAFVAIIGLADVFGVNPWKSFWSNFERMEGYITIIHLFLYFIVAASVLATEKIWKWFLGASVSASAIMSFVALGQYVSNILAGNAGARLDAKLGNPTYLAIYLIFNVFFALALLSRDKFLWKRIGYGLIAAFDTFIIYHTATRGAVLGLIGGLFLSALLVALFDKGEKRKRIIAVSAVGAVLVLVLGFIAVRDASFVKNSPVLSRFATISWEDTKNQARQYIWPMAIEGFKERPILGWGQENFNYVFNKNYDPRMYAQEQWFDRSHNVVLDWLMNGGVMGLLSYLSLFGAALYLLWKKTSDMSFAEKSLFTGLFSAYFFHNLFVFDNIASYLLFVATLAFIHFKSTRLAHPVAPEADEMDDSDFKTAAVLVILVLIFSLYFFNWRGFATNRALITAVGATSVLPINGQAALDAFKTALSYDTLGRPEIVERLVQAVEAMNGGGISIEVRQKFYELAKDAIDTQLIRSPGDARYEVFAGNFYSLYNDEAKALEHFTNAQKLSPNKQSILFQLGNFYLTYNQNVKAIEVFKKAVDLDSSYTDAFKYYALALAYDGQYAAASALLKEKMGTSTVPDEVFLSAYAHREEWNKVIAVLKKKIIADPTDIENRTNLVSVYIQAGDKASAIAAVREIIKINPAFKTAGEQYIAQIEAGK